jgi:hypothetical protein
MARAPRARVKLGLTLSLAVPPKEIHRVRRKYKTLVKAEDMTKDEFYALPAISVSPLRDQLFKSLELSPSQTIAFAVRSATACLLVNLETF